MKEAIEKMRWHLVWMVYAMGIITGLAIASLILTLLEGG